MGSNMDTGTPINDIGVDNSTGLIFVGDASEAVGATADICWISVSTDTEQNCTSFGSVSSIGEVESVAVDQATNVVFAAICSGYDTTNTDVIVDALNGSTGAGVVASTGVTSPSPTLRNSGATVTGGGTALGTTVVMVAANVDQGMGSYEVAPGASVLTDANSWAATYTTNAEYSIITGP